MKIIGTKFNLIDSAPNYYIPNLQAFQQYLMFPHVPPFSLKWSKIAMTSSEILQRRIKTRYQWNIFYNTNHYLMDIHVKIEGRELISYLPARRLKFYALIFYLFDFIFYLTLFSWIIVESLLDIRRLMYSHLKKILMYNVYTSVNIFRKNFRIEVPPQPFPWQL